MTIFNNSVLEYEMENLSDSRNKGWEKWIQNILKGGHCQLVLAHSYKAETKSHFYNSKTGWRVVV